MKIDLPQDVIAAIDKYNAAQFSIGSIGALNLVAFIGERVAALVVEQRRSKVTTGQGYLRMRAMREA